MQALAPRRRADLIATPRTDRQFGAGFIFDFEEPAEPRVCAKSIRLRRGGTRPTKEEIYQRWCVVRGSCTSSGKLSCSYLELSRDGEKHSVACERCVFLSGQAGVAIHFSGKWRFRVPLIPSQSTIAKPLFYWNCGAVSSPRQPVLRTMWSDHLAVQMYRGSILLFDHPLDVSQEWPNETVGRPWSYRGGGNRLQYRYVPIGNGGAHTLDVHLMIDDGVYYCVDTVGDWTMRLHG